MSEANPAQVQFTAIQNDEDIQQVLALQRANLSSQVSPEVAASQGFVTVQHNFELLKQMNGAAPQVIAKIGETVVGYALVMLPAFQDLVPVLKPMFLLFDDIDYLGRKIADYRYYVMGQVCVADGHRGAGIFDGLYAKHRDLYQEQFDFVITEIASRNTRSVRAHQRVGFETIHRFQDVTDHWEVVLWDWH